MLPLMGSVATLEGITRETGVADSPRRPLSLTFRSRARTLPPSSMQYAFDMTPLGLVVRLRGPVRGGVAVSSWHDALRQCCAQGQRRIVVDCADVDAVDAAGLGAMVGALAIMRNAGGDLAIARVPNALRSLLLITRLTDILPPHPSVEAACRSIALPPQPPGRQPRPGRYS